MAAELVAADAARFDDLVAVGMEDQYNRSLRLPPSSLCRCLGLRGGRQLRSNHALRAAFTSSSFAGGRRAR